MKVKYVINNYILGSRFKMTRRYNIIFQNRIDKSHTEVIYDLKSEREKQMLDKILTYKGIMIGW